jgi:hypothetical protein
MATANVRLSRSAHQALCELAKQEGTTIQAAAERAIENTGANTSWRRQINTPRFGTMRTHGVKR